MTGWRPSIRRARTFGPKGPTLGDLSDAYLQDYQVRQFRSQSAGQPRRPVRLEFQILFMTATLCGPGGVRAVIAEHLLLKQQLLVLHRPRQRAPHLTASDRRLFGFGSLFFSPGRIRKIAI